MLSMQTLARRVLGLLLAGLTATAALKLATLGLARLDCWWLPPLVVAMAWPLWAYRREQVMFVRRLLLSGATTETSRLRRWFWRGTVQQSLRVVTALLWAERCTPSGAELTRFIKGEFEASLEWDVGRRAGARARHRFRCVEGKRRRRRRDRRRSMRQNDMRRKLKPVSPGEMLAVEFLKPLGMSHYRPAKEIGVPAQCIGETPAGKRAITADTERRLWRNFGHLDVWWLRLQADNDTEVAKASLAKMLAKIRPWKEAAEQAVDAL